MDNELHLYLDHLIPRENLRYRRSDERLRENLGNLPHKLRMADLYGDHLASRDKKLRKPDFQRATYAWTPEACIELLDSVINDQVIPSIIMWPSVDSGYDFVLDGAHRISVVMAWLRDDWGQGFMTGPEIPFEEEESRHIQEAATRVRQLVELKIGTFADFGRAAKRFDEVVEAGEAPKSALDQRTLQQARFHQRLSRGDIGFDILWVEGNYEKAEQSFLKINSTGKPLTEWERKLIENRNSSFARTVMSVSYPASAKYYWPDDAPQGQDYETLREKIDDIVSGVTNLHDTLFKPTYQTQIKRLKQPLLATAESEKRPYWVAELMTIIAGGRGQESETEKLLSRDSNATERDIINTGFALMGDIQTTLEHVTGATPRSLGLVPALYFYSENGRYVRSLLYGLVYWLVSNGSDETILARKRVYCAHRAAFEAVLMSRKQSIVNRLSRNSGSGPEVTFPTARYYQRLLEILIEHQDSIDSQSFERDYMKLLEGLTSKKNKASETSEAKSRTFTESQKNTLWLREQLARLSKCGICGGMIDPEEDVQHDHILPVFRGGTTTPTNQRMVHPFCNNQANREAIEGMKARQIEIKLPPFVDPEVATTIQQLSFIDAPGFY